MIPTSTRSTPTFDTSCSRPSTNWPRSAGSLCLAETMAISDRLTETIGIIATMGRARLLAPMRPDKYLRIAAALQNLPKAPQVLGIMARNHRGFAEALIAANRIAADVLLLNTSFAGPALAEVVQRESVDAFIYDEESTETVDRALADQPDA